jgi:hypothetical protein
MAKIKKYDRYGIPIYDVSDLEEYVYSGKEKLYKIPEGGICDADGYPLGMLDLMGLGISLEEPEETETAIGLCDDEIKKRLEQTEDETECNELKFRLAYNRSARGEGSSCIEPVFGGVTHLGKLWAKDIVEEKVKSIIREQDEYFNKLPSEDKTREKLMSMFGVDYGFRVEKRGDTYFIDMFDEDTGKRVHFMIRDKNIYTLTYENEEPQHSETEDIFKEQTKSILAFIYGE